jgi:thymidylate synthase (FAD)
MKVTIQEHTNPINLGKYAGICYGKEGSDEKRLKHIIEVGHLSVLRFGMAVFKVEGISRVCLAQLTRSKHLDYLVRSSRYCDESECKFIWPEILHPEQRLELEQYARDLYSAAINAGLKKQDARYLLPQSQATELYVVGNYHAWKDFIRLRTSKSAQSEIREVAIAIQNELHKIAPEIFKAI